MKKLTALVLGVLVLAGTATAQDDTAKKIVGKWEITKAGGQAEAGSVIEFAKDGKLTATVKVQGTDIKGEGTYKLDKDKLAIKLKIGDTDVEETLTVKEVTDKVLKLEDKDKKVDELKKLDK
jgi:uncharacterized protein (TIGR03066 family)